MGVYNGNNVKIGPGTLYAAPIGSTEPIAVTGAWAAGWTLLGYTEQGSEFDFTPTLADVMVEEEFWPIRKVPTAYSGKLTFILAEVTAQNLMLLLNNGIGSSTVAASHGTNVDGSLWVEPPVPGSEVRVMLGWDSLTEGAASGADPFHRLICRQTIQSGTIKIVRRKGNNKTSFSAEFDLEKPPNLQPFRQLFEPNLAN